MKKKLLWTLFGALLAQPTFARDFTYEYEGQTLTYSVIDETAKTCKTWDGYLGKPGNNVSGQRAYGVLYLRRSNGEIQDRSRLALYLSQALPHPYL